MAYVKLDCGIVKSTLWVDREAREVFITALLMAEPTTIEKPTPQLEVRTLNQTGWMIPPGAYGLVDAAGVGILGFARIDKEVGMAALERLGSPELDSRSQAYDGRRLVRIDGGYIVLNFASYRDKDHTAKDRMRRFREKKKLAGNGVTLRNGDVTQRIVTDSREQNAEGIKQREEAEAAAHWIPECPRDMDLEPEHRAFCVWCGEKGQATTFTRWRRWILRAKESGRYAKCKPRPPTAEEIADERRKILERRQADA